MNDVIAQAENSLLTPAGIDINQLSPVFDRLLGRGINYGDLYFQRSRRESWSVEDGIVKDGAHSIEQGVGVRAVSEEKTGFAYTDDFNLAGLIESAGSAKAISRSGRVFSPGTQIQRAGASLYQAIDPIDQLANEEKLHHLRRIESRLRAADPRVVQVSVSISGGVDTILLVRSDGVVAADHRPLVRFNVQVIVEQAGRRESGYAGGGGRYAYALLFDGGHADRWADEALRQALVNLEAVDAPAGTMPVILGPGWPGVLLHEAVGHGLEADFNRKGTSIFSGRIGERVASPGVSIVDDGTLPGRRGSLNIDDEGTPSQCTMLIEDGILKGYMQDTMNARLMGVEPTGNGRRESFAHLPMPRMTNTYMLAGNKDPQEIIASVRKGLYAVNFGGGQVDITSGKFVFSASEAYLIENGKIGAPVKGATLIGNGPEVMNQVSMIGNDLALDEGVGVCGKDGQSVPVGVGQPTLRIDALTVGGTRSS